MRTYLLTLATATLLSLASQAEPIFVRNRPFKGPSSGTGASQTVGLRELAAALEFSVLEKNGGYLVNTEEGEPKDGEVLINGRSLMSVAGETGPSVNLKEFSEAAGLVYRPNKAMGTIDISKGPAANNRTSAGDNSAAALATPGQAIVLNQTTPGVYVNLDSLLVSGKYTFILLYKDNEKDAVYKSMFTWVDRFLKNPEIVLYKINIGYPGSPMASSMREQFAPRLLVFGKNKKHYGRWGGHSIPQTENIEKDFVNFPTYRPNPNPQFR